jgi:hypothetical protein
MTALPRTPRLRPALLALVGPLLLGSPLAVPLAGAQPGSAGYPGGYPGGSAVTGELPPRYGDQQLDNLLGPVALYPDALLAQLLVAATFPDQLQEAASHVRAYGTGRIDDQWWDVSVKAVAHYPSALNLLADRIDWTTALGVAYANQSSDVMAAVQRLRRMADQQGNLLSTPQQQVVVERGSYVITPAQPRVIYVPVYDPVVIYTQPVFRAAVGNRFWSFGVGFPIGGWLSYDCDWGARRVYYHGWNSAWMGWGGGWRVRARPFIQVTNVYVAPRYRDVFVNVNVNHRVINYRNVDRWRGPHRDTWFAPQYGGRGDGRFDDRDRDRGRDRDRDGDRDGWRGEPPVTRRAEPVVAAAPRREPGYATPDGYRRAAPRMEPVDPREENRPADRGGERGGNRPEPRGEDRGDRRRIEWPVPPRMEPPPPALPRGGDPRGDRAGGDDPRGGRMALPRDAGPMRRPEPRQEPRQEPRAQGRPEPRGDATPPRSSEGGERRTARPRGAGERPPG